MDDDHFGLIPRPDGQLVGKPLDQLPAIRRVTSEVLAHVQRLPVQQKRVRIAGFELCAPDAELITVWASAIQVSPDELLEHLSRTRLYAKRSIRVRPLDVEIVHSQIVVGSDVEVVEFEMVDGELRALVWDLDRFPSFPDLWVSGLKLRKFGLSAPKGCNTALTLTPTAPDLHELWVWGPIFTDVSPNEPPRIGKLALNGVKHLKRLVCSIFIVKEIDLSSVRGLQELYCWGTQTEALDLSPVPDLQKLTYWGNRLTQLDLSLVQNLKELRCGNNQLTEIDLSAVVGLQLLECNGNLLTKIDLSAVNDLKNLDCSENPIADIDLTPVMGLRYLRCYFNQLTELGLSPVPHLSSLDCGDNSITVLDLSSLTGLTSLSCGGNPLTQLDLSAATGLQNLWCDSNELTELDLSNVTSLQFLNCSGNHLAALDLSATTSLTSLYCSGNSITEITLPPTLRSVECDRSVVLHNRRQDLEEWRYAHDGPEILRLTLR